MYRQRQDTDISAAVPPSGKSSPGRPGAVLGGGTDGVACDHHHPRREVIALLKELGVRSYRFPVSRPPVQPTGSGSVRTARPGRGPGMSPSRFRKSFVR
ncbi:family 1 glycosylhydrolase [Streptomyces sp. NPDC051315]|uniref:family 1 glycosylhydrolase n=1 Tax=Streptomyces sp. NPDC051315 TaxID=3365650 RepID=UPI0037B228A1